MPAPSGGGDASSTTYRAWNVSCDGMSSLSDERTCIARPWNHSSNSPPRYQLTFENYDIPPPRWMLMNWFRDSARACQRAKPGAGDSKSTSAPTPCCTSLNPEPGRAGRCHHLASASAKKCSKSSSFVRLCPVACVDCLICQNHSLYSFYVELMSKLPHPPEHYRRGMTAVREAKMNVEAAKTASSDGVQLHGAGRPEQLALMQDKIKRLEESQKKMDDRLSQVLAGLQAMSSRRPQL